MVVSGKWVAAPKITLMGDADGTCVWQFSMKGELHRIQAEPEDFDAAKLWQFSAQVKLELKKLQEGVLRGRGGFTTENMLLMGGRRVGR